MHTIFFIVANEVSDLIFTTIHFHLYTQVESFIYNGVGEAGVMGQRMDKSYITEILPDKLIFVKNQ